MAVGSRSADRARAFAGRHEIAHAHGRTRTDRRSHDIDVDLHRYAVPEHFPIAMAAIEAGKAGSSRKHSPRQSGRRTDRRCRSRRTCRSRWRLRLDPVSAGEPPVRRWIDDGAIGDLRAVQADLGVFAGTTRETDCSPGTGGGALLGSGWRHPVSSRAMVSGQSACIVATRERASGVRWTRNCCSPIRGQGASLTTPFTRRCRVPRDYRVRMAGSCAARFHHPTDVVPHVAGADRACERTAHRRGLRTRAHRGHQPACAQAGPTATSMPLDDTLAVQRILESGTQLASMAGGRQLQSAETTRADDRNRSVTDFGSVNSQRGTATRSAATPVRSDDRRRQPCATVWRYLLLHHFFITAARHGEAIGRGHHHGSRRPGEDVIGSVPFGSSVRTGRRTPATRGIGRIDWAIGRSQDRWGTPIAVDGAPDRRGAADASVRSGANLYGRSRVGSRVDCPTGLEARRLNATSSGGPFPPRRRPIGVAPLTGSDPLPGRTTTIRPSGKKVCPNARRVDSCPP